MLFGARMGRPLLHKAPPEFDGDFLTIVKIACAKFLLTSMKDKGSPPIEKSPLCLRPTLPLTSGEGGGCDSIMQRDEHRTQNA